MKKNVNFGKPKMFREIANPQVVAKSTWIFTEHSKLIVRKFQCSIAGGSHVTNHLVGGRHIAPPHQEQG